MPDDNKNESIRKLFEAEVVKRMIMIGITELIADSGYTNLDPLSIELFVEDKFDMIVDKTMDQFNGGT